MYIAKSTISNTIDMTFEPGHHVTFELTIYGVAL